MPASMTAAWLRRVDFEHAELAFDDLRTRTGFGGLDGNVHHPEHFVAWRHLDVQGGHALGRQVTLGDRADEGGELGLHAVQVAIAAQGKCISHMEISFLLGQVFLTPRSRRITKDTKIHKGFLCFPC